MGFFNRKDNKEREESLKIKQLLDYIEKENKNANIDDSVEPYVKRYIEQVRKTGENDFEDIETLAKVIASLIENGACTNTRIASYLNKMKLIYARIVPKNGDEQVHDYMKEKFLHYFLGKDGIINQNIFDEGMFASFDNKTDYFDVVDCIIELRDKINPKIVLDYIKEYANKVSKYCLTEDVYKRDVVSYICGLDSVVNGDFESYTEEQLEDAKKRIGVYSLSPKDLAECDSKLSKMGDYLEQFGIYRTNLEEEKKAVSHLISLGKKEIKTESDKSVQRLRELIEENKNAIIEQLNNYIVDLEKTLKDKSDVTFREIVETYKEQVEEFRGLFLSYSKAAAEDFIAVQKASEESVRKLEDYVMNEPQLQELLNKAQEQNEVRSKIVELVTKEKEALKGTRIEPKKEEIILPGYERVMVPYRRIILPPEVNRSILPSLDNSIPFSERKEKIEEEIEKREKNGEIFHKKVKEIAVDIMEGDWPYLWGPSGTGKSFMLKQVADILGMELIKAGKITEPYSVLGYNDPQGRYRITPTFIAALYGKLLLQDEFDNGNTDTHVVLNDIYSESLNKQNNPNEVCEVMFGEDIPVDLNPNFRMVAAGNTSGNGENSAFSSRGKMDESILERLTPVYIGYDNRVEERILKDYPEWYRFTVAFRDACIEFANNNGLDSPQGITTTRDADAIKKYIDHNSKSIDQIIQEKFVQIKDSEYLTTLAKIIARQYNVDYNNCEEFDYSKPLKKADGKVLAKKFICACKRGDR